MVIYISQPVPYNEKYLKKIFKLDFNPTQLSWFSHILNSRSCYSLAGWALHLTNHVILCPQYYQSVWSFGCHLVLSVPQCVVFHYDSLETRTGTTVSIILAARRNICIVVASKVLVQINITKVVDLFSLDIMIKWVGNW